MLLLLSAEFIKVNLFKNYFRNTIRMSNGLDTNQDRRSVSLDLGPNCLQRLSADKSPLTMKEFKMVNMKYYFFSICTLPVLPRMS